MTDLEDLGRFLDDGCPHDGTVPCPACAGSGTRTVVCDQWWGKGGQIVRCDGCGGEGRMSPAGALERATAE
jgi:DnaJ-class molecular chaperone